MLEFKEQIKPIKGNGDASTPPPYQYTKGACAMDNSQYIPPEENRQEDGSQNNHIVSRYASEKRLYCEQCQEEIFDILNQAALVWRRIADKTSETLTAFHITHRSPKCINKVFFPAITPHWLPLSDFFNDGEFTFEYFLLPRFDSDANPIDLNVQINRQSLARIGILINPIKIQTRIVSNRRHGFVYLIKSPTGAYKIGRTSNPKNRIKTFSVKLPFEVEYVCVIQTQDMYGLEQSLHQKFSEKRVNGEWFNLSPDDVEHIKGMAE